MGPAGASIPPGAKKLEIEYKTIASDIYEVRLSGELGMGSVLSLDRVFKKIFEEKIFKIVVNLEATHYIASSGIGVFLATTEAARKNGGEVFLAGATPRVRHVFELMGLTGTLNFSPSVKDAVKSFKK